jgi:hypothetical protein
MGKSPYRCDVKDRADRIFLVSDAMLRAVVVGGSLTKAGLRRRKIRG